MTNQMTTGVIQSIDFRFMLFHLEVTLADGVDNCRLGNLSESTTEMIIYVRASGILTIRALRYAHRFRFAWTAASRGLPPQKAC